MVTSCMLLPAVVRTSLRDFGKRQTRTALKVDVVGEDQGAQGSEGLAGEEVSFAALWSVSLQKNSQSRTRRATDVFEVLEQIGDSLPLAIGEDRLVQAIAGFSCDIIRIIFADVVEAQSRTSTA